MHINKYQYISTDINKYQYVYQEISTASINANKYELIATNVKRKWWRNCNETNEKLTKTRFERTLARIPSETLIQLLPMRKLKLGTPKIHLAVSCCKYDSRQQWFFYISMRNSSQNQYFAPCFLRPPMAARDNIYGRAGKAAPVWNDIAMPRALFQPSTTTMTRVSLKECPPPTLPYASRKLSKHWKHWKLPVNNWKLFGNHGNIGNHWSFQCFQWFP